MSEHHDSPIIGELLEDERALTLGQLSRVCRVPAEQIISLVEEGVIEPQVATEGRWRFSGTCIHRVQCAFRLQTDLGVNRAGAALALELIEEVRRLRARLGPG